MYPPTVTGSSDMAMVCIIQTAPRFLSHATSGGYGGDDDEMLPIIDFSDGVRLHLILLNFGRSVESLPPRLPRWVFDRSAISL
ncbi:hypothetical protein HC928_15085 [bacterium]|nr:hypothetical protein [bacterium]